MLKGFDFLQVEDLGLNIAEMQAVNTVYLKQKVNQNFWHEDPQTFVENFIRCAIAGKGCNVVPSVIMAQGIDESGWFSTDSLFGVKATKLQTSEGIGTQANTQEVVNGTSVPAIATFFETPSVQNNFGNYYNYVAREKPDSGRFLPSDAVGYLNYLQQEPLAYSTAGAAYVTTMLSIIRDNGLSAFDHA